VARCHPLLERSKMSTTDTPLPVVHRETFSRLATALSALTKAASAGFGADCMGHAKLAQAILLQEGISTRLVAGAAAWRIGPGTGDVISHLPTRQDLANASSNAFPYHAWLEWDGNILDFSTHSLGSKAKQLDAQDGGTTTVNWCPLYLLLTPDQVRSMEDVAQAESFGLAFYHEIPGFLEFLLTRGLREAISDVDLSLLRYTFDNPSLNVFGPNDSIFTQDAGEPVASSPRPVPYSEPIVRSTSG